MLPMHQKKVTWSDLRVGIFIVLGLAVIVSTVLFFQPGRGFAHTVKVRALFASIGGLSPGASVRMSGVDIGTVVGMRFVNPASIPSNQALLDELQELKNEMSRLNLKNSSDRQRYFRDERSYAELQSQVKHVAVLMDVSAGEVSMIRSNSVALLKNAGLVGEKYIEITPSTADSPRLSLVADAGGTQALEVQSVEAPDINTILGNASGFTESLQDITTEVDYDIKHGRGTIGKLLTTSNVHDALYETLKSTAEATKYSGELLQSIQQGRGSLGKIFNDPSLYNSTVNILHSIDSTNSTLGKLIHDPSIYNDTDHAILRINELVRKVYQENGTLQKLIQDPALYRNANKAAQGFSELLAGANAGRGSLGRFANDPALYLSANRAADDLARVAEQLQRGDGSLGLLVKDKRLYENMTALSEELLGLVREIRKDPKKYLTVHFNAVKFF